MALLEWSHPRVRGYKGSFGQCKSIALLCRWSWLPTGPSRSTEPIQQLEENIQKAEPRRLSLIHLLLQTLQQEEIWLGQRKKGGMDWTGLRKGQKFNPKRNQTVRELGQDCEKYIHWKNIKSPSCRGLRDLKDKQWKPNPWFLLLYNFRKQSTLSVQWN